MIIHMLFSDLSLVCFSHNIFFLITGSKNCLKYFTRELTSANFGENIFTFLPLQISVPALPQTAFAVLSSQHRVPWAGLSCWGSSCPITPHHRHKGWEHSPQVKSWGLCFTWLVSEWPCAFAYFLLPINRPPSQFPVSKRLLLQVPLFTPLLALIHQAARWLSLKDLSSCSLPFLQVTHTEQ